MSSKSEYCWPGWPNFSEDEASLIGEVLLSNQVNYWTGSRCIDFERQFAKLVGCDFGVAVSNGTVALELALFGLGVGERNGGTKNDEVIVTPRSFVASASTILLAGAKPIFVDVDLESQNISPSSIANAITQHTRAIICVHHNGWPCDMDKIIRLTNGKDIKIIEDCAQAHGAIYKGTPVGCLGDVAAWSFCQDKIITTAGEGGMLTTNDPAIRDRVWSFKDHGKSEQKVKQSRGLPGFKWVHENLGSNFRLTEIQAAIGLHQLTKLEEWTKQRANNANLLTQYLQDFDPMGNLIRVPKITADAASNFDQPETWHANYKFYFFVNSTSQNVVELRNSILFEIQKAGVNCFVGSCPEIYLEGVFKDRSIKPATRLPNAKLLGETSLALQVHPTLSEQHINQMGAVVCEVLSSVLLG